MKLGCVRCYVERMPWFYRHPTGRPPHPDVLTPAEWRVLEHVREGRSNSEIAEVLGVSLNTVKTQISSMLGKLELGDRFELAAWDGAPAEASRVALGRMQLAVPFGWLGRAAAGAGVVALGVVFLLAMQWMNDSSPSGGGPEGTRRAHRSRAQQAHPTRFPHRC